MKTTAREQPCTCGVPTANLGNNHRVATGTICIHCYIVQNDIQKLRSQTGGLTTSTSGNPRNRIYPRNIPVFAERQNFRTSRCDQNLANGLIVRFKVFVFQTTNMSLCFEHPFRDGTIRRTATKLSQQRQIVTRATTSDDHCKRRLHSKASLFMLLVFRITSGNNSQLIPFFLGRSLGVFNSAHNRYRSRRNFR
jgi:hypothetical protein